MHRVHRKEVPLKPYFPFPTGKTLFPITRLRKGVTIERAPMAKSYLLAQQLRRIVHPRLSEVIQNNLNDFVFKYAYLCTPRNIKLR